MFATDFLGRTLTVPADALLQIGTLGAIGIGNIAPTNESILVTESYTTPYAGIEGTVKVQITTKNSGDVTMRRGAYVAEITDASGVNQVNVTDASNASPIVITTASPHGYATGDKVAVQQVGGNTAANAAWLITVIDSTHLSLDGSTGNGAYTSGGFITNRSMMSGVIIRVGVNVARGGYSGALAAGDDADGLTIINSGTAKGTDAIFVAASPAVTGNEWVTILSHLGEADVGVQLGGAYSIAAMRLGGSIMFCPANSSTQDVRIRRPTTNQLAIDNAAGGNATLAVQGSYQLGATVALGGGVGVFGIANAGTIPNANPAGGGVLYAEGGALKWRGSSGTITQLAAA